MTKKGPDVAKAFKVSSKKIKTASKITKPKKAAKGSSLDGASSNRKAKLQVKVKLKSSSSTLGLKSKTKVKPKPSLKGVKKSLATEIKATAGRAVGTKARSKVANPQNSKKNLRKSSTQPAASVTPFRFTPLEDRILVRVIESESVTAGGIIIPGTVSDDQGYHRAQVVEVGLGKKDKKGRVKPVQVMRGEYVLFQKHSGEKIDINGATYFIVRESDLLGVTQ